MHKTRLLVIMMFVLTAIGGAAVAGFGTADAKAATLAAASQRRQDAHWYDAKNCYYKVHLDGVGAGGFTAHVHNDSCHHTMWAVALCGSGKLIYGNHVSRAGTKTTTIGPCGAGNFSLIWWGVRDNQWQKVWLNKKDFVIRKEHYLHCLSTNPCNNSGGI